MMKSVSYAHPNRDMLFEDIDFLINSHKKIALIGNNGAGKSTLLKILAGEFSHATGAVIVEPKPYYMPQLVGQFNEYTVAQALQIEAKLRSLHEILNGEVTEKNMETLADDWAIEERCYEALAQWKLGGISLSQKMETLSGGQKTKIFLAGLNIHDPQIILLDEPTNHLDIEGREILYDHIVNTKSSVLLVSHDRTLLNMVQEIYELSPRGLRVYGGNYDFYLAQRQVENDALNNELRSKEKALRKAKETERESAERQQKLDARGKKKQEKAGVPTILLNTLRNSAEKSTAKMKDVHAEKTKSISNELSHLRNELPDADKMKINFNQSGLHKGKILITATAVNVDFDDGPLWAQPLDLQILSGERIALKGPNGSGKTTLIKMMLDLLFPGSGTLMNAGVRSVYIDQEYSLVNGNMTVYEQAQQFNTGHLQEHEIKIRLTRFLFTKDDWDKSCRALSGGEKMRLTLCCLTIDNNAPDMIVLDEPTNNLDIQNIEILTSTINKYEGTLLIVSHDESFLREISIQREINITR